MLVGVRFPPLKQWRVPLYEKQPARLISWMVLLREARRIPATMEFVRSPRLDCRCPQWPTERIRGECMYTIHTTIYTQSAVGESTFFFFLQLLPGLSLPLSGGPGASRSL